MSNWTSPPPKLIRQFIRSTGHTTTAVAQILNVTPRTVNRWKSGERKMDYCQDYAMRKLLIKVLVDKRS